MPSPDGPPGGGLGGSVVVLVDLVEDVHRLLDRPPGAAQQLLVHRELAPAGDDAVAQAHDGEVGELLADALEPPLDVVELACHEAEP